MKKKTKSRKDYIKELDKRFSYFIRLRDCDSKGYIVCPLCWKKIHRKKAQNMHFIKRSVLMYRRCEYNCWAWCVWCNVILNGNYIKYTLFMIDKFWLEQVMEMQTNASKVFKISTSEIIEKIEYYKEKVKELCIEKNLTL